MDIKLSNLNKKGQEIPEGMIAKPAWRNRPTRAPRAVKKSMEALFDCIDNYHETQAEQGIPPTLCDMAGEAGFDSVAQMTNHARRKGGETMRGISRGILAVAASYEELAQNGNKNALHMLGLMPHFDSEEPTSQAPQLPLSPKQEVNVNITGVSQVETRGAQLSEQEAYLQLIKHKTYEEIAADVLGPAEIEGEYEVVEIEIDD